MAKKPAKKPAAKLRAPKTETCAETQTDTKCLANKRSDKRGTPKRKGTIKPKHGGKIGNPPHVPTPELKKIAETHAAVGTPHWAIAAEMDISEDTLQRHYKRELDLGLIRMNARIGSNVAKKALEGDGRSEHFWLARRGGAAWANKQELSTAPGQPLEFRNLSDEEVKAKIAEHEARRRAGK